MTLSIERFVLLLGVFPTTALFYSFGLFWSIDPSLFRLFSFSDHILNSAAISIYIIAGTLWLSAVASVFSLNVDSRFPGLPRRIRTVSDRLPYLLFVAFGVSTGFTYVALPALGRSSDFLTLFTLFLLAVAGVTLIIRKRYRRIENAPRNLLEALFLVTTLAFVFMSGTIEGQLIRHGNIDDDLCAIVRDDTGTKCYPVIMFGGSNSLLSNGPSKFKIHRSDEIDVVFNSKRN